MNTPKKHTGKKDNQTTKELFESFSKPDYLDEPTKPIYVKKTINGFDYLNALVRIPEIQNDFDVISKTTDKEKIKELSLKYITICGYPLEYLQKSEIFYRYNKYYHNSEAIHVLSNWQKDNLNSRSEYRDGKHVILAVDITKKKTVIKKEFEKVLRRVEKDYNISKDTTKDKDTIEDIWKIYDYKTKDKLSRYKIAQKLSGIKNCPAYNETVGNCLKRVGTAFRKAKKIIDAVKKDVEEATREYEKHKEVDRELKEMLNRAAEDSKKERTPTIVDLLFGRTPKK